jgi:hypothetical protein
LDVVEELTSRLAELQEADAAQRTAAAGESGRIRDDARLPRARRALRKLVDESRAMSVQIEIVRALLSHHRRAEQEAERSGYLATTHLSSVNGEGAKQY